MNVNVGGSDVAALAKLSGIDVEKGYSTMWTGVELRVLAGGRGPRHHGEVLQRPHAVVGELLLLPILRCHRPHSHAGEVGGLYLLFDRGGRPQCQRWGLLHSDLSFLPIGLSPIRESQEMLSETGVLLGISPGDGLGGGLGSGLGGGLGGGLGQRGLLCLVFLFLIWARLRGLCFNGMITHNCVMARDCKSRKKELGVDSEVLLLTLKFPP